MTKKRSKKETGLEFLDVMTPMEKFWVFSTATMFIFGKGDRLVNLQFLSFPIFVRLFKELLKEMGMKSSKKFIKDWEWLLYATFLTIISLNNFGKPIVKKEKQPIYMIKDGSPFTEEESLIAKLINKVKALAAKNDIELQTGENDIEFFEDGFSMPRNYDDGSGTGILFESTSRRRTGSL